MVVAVPCNETVFFLRQRLTLKELLPYLRGFDYVLLEGFELEKTLPKIIAAKTAEEAASFSDGLAVAVSGIILESKDEAAKALKLQSPLLSSMSQAEKLAENLLSNQAFYGVHASKTSAGATVVDAGVNVPGGFEVGEVLTEICMGGAGKAQISFKTYGELTLPSITVSTAYPAIAALGF